MAINFPNNRDQLDPPQPSGPLQQGDAFTDAGQTWTWNSGLGVWSTDPNGGADLDALYLSKVNDDTAEGAITFEGQTTHEGGVSVTGGSNAVGTGFIYSSSDERFIAVSDGSRVAAVDDSGQFVFGGQTPYGGCRIALRGTLPENSGGNSTFVRAESKFNASSSEVYGFYIRTSPNANTFTGNVTGFRSFAETTNWDNAGTYKAFEAAETFGYSSENYGFYSALGDVRSGATGYNFYAAGTAPNYFAGDTIISSQGPDVATRTGGVRIGNGGATTFYRGGAATDNPVTIRRTNTSLTGTARAIKFETHDGSSGSFIKVNGDIQKVTRSVTSSVPMPDGAATIVKALQPKLITQGNETFSGFLYPDLAGTYSEATDSEAEGVCRENLIPLLTKALQETIAKNEDLEARLSALEGA